MAPHGAGERPPAFVWLIAIEYFVARTVLDIKPIPAGAVVVITNLAIYIINFVLAPSG